jgi:hypothetical protein
VGTVRAVGAGFAARPWIAAGVLADTVDLVATWRARDELPTLAATGVAALAAASAGLGVYLQTAVD